jgi:hypothetical protein
MDKATAALIEEVSNFAKEKFSESKVPYEEIWIEVDDRSPRGPSIVFRFIAGRAPSVERYRRQAKKGKRAENA